MKKSITNNSYIIKAKAAGILLFTLLWASCAEETKLPPCVSDFSYPEGSYSQDNPQHAAPIYSAGADVPGIFSSTDGLVFADTHTGEIDLANSLPGSYTVRKTMIGNASCGNRITMARITIVPPASAPKKVTIRFPITGTYFITLADNRIGGPHGGPEADRYFEWYQLDNGYHAFRSLKNGQFLRASHDPGNYLVANGGEEADEEWEQFILEVSDKGEGGHAIKCVANNLYLNVENVPDFLLRAVAGGVDTWETFQISEIQE
ncbi:hypothetical protein JHJ32_13280 [Parapedobacter sp. ISTM3]|uniref:fascin domain-containing protein n=1 Tax=Parapedobacter sp. ISTM3 TaxID=2800130 RepID=UPI0019043A2B|nr:hypothetical protein [Parapedobacter sp. ISTM3]MBK1440966.1 hypothetical protein [Parapedobacter sp. ISTM3]